MPEHKPPDRRSIRWILYTSLFGPLASLLILVARWIYLHKDEPEFYLLLINYIVAWLPFAFSILIAFIPDMRKLHKFWRGLVILGGLTYSVVLFQQQVLTMEANKRDQQSAIEQAVKQSNDHSDAQIASVKSEMKSEIQSTNSKIDQLPSTFSQAMKTNTSMLTQAIVKVNPYALDHAQLQFSLFVKDSSQFPLTDYYFPRQDDGTINVQFWVKNISKDTSTGKGDIWVQICGGCGYPKEPSGFVKREGSDEHIRHKMFEYLNAGIGFEPMLIPVRPPPQGDVFQISFKYSCETCGGITKWQTMTVRTTRELVPKFTQPTKPKSAKH